MLLHGALHERDLFGILPSDNIDRAGIKERCRDPFPDVLDGALDVAFTNRVQKIDGPAAPADRRNVRHSIPDTSRGLKVRH